MAPYETFTSVIQDLIAAEPADAQIATAARAQVRAEALAEAEEAKASVFDADLALVAVVRAQS